MPSNQNIVESIQMSDLKDILVVSLEQAVAAPYCSGRLADAGARVIKIEREEGDFARRYDSHVNGESAYFVWLNRGKESLCLNLRDDKDKTVFGNILAKADVFIQNLAPGAVSRLGFDPKQLRKRFPRLIICSITGYGSDGPYANQKAYDLLVQCESGLAMINGTPEGAARVGVSVCDIAAGMNAHQAITQALYAREKNGDGRLIEVSMYQALADWMNVPYLQYVYGNHEAERCGLAHPTIAPYGAYQCKDDKAVVFSIQNEREWLSLCENFLGDASIATRPEFETNSARVANRSELDQILNPEFSRLNREEAINKLDKANIAYGRLSSLEDLKHHPQNQIIEIDTPSGPITMLAPATTTDATKVTYRPVPSIDEHGKNLRHEFS